MERVEEVQLAAARAAVTVRIAFTAQDQASLVFMLPIEALACCQWLDVCSGPSICRYPLGNSQPFGGSGSGPAAIAGRP